MELESYPISISKFTPLVRFRLMKKKTDNHRCIVCNSELNDGDDIVQLNNHYSHSSCLVWSMDKIMGEEVITEEAKQKFGIEYVARRMI
jgi:hypothetical protein